MPTSVWLDRQQMGELLGWLRNQLDASRRPLEDAGAADLGDAMEAAVEELALHAHLHNNTGKTARRALQQAGWALRERPGYDDTWRPYW